MNRFKRAVCVSLIAITAIFAGGCLFPVGTKKESASDKFISNMTVSLPVTIQGKYSFSPKIKITEFKIESVSNYSDEYYISYYVLAEVSGGDQSYISFYAYFYDSDNVKVSDDFIMETAASGTTVRCKSTCFVAKDAVKVEFQI